MARFLSALVAAAALAGAAAAAAAPMAFSNEVDPDKAYRVDSPGRR